jgi:hypothetical protein
MTIMPCVSVSDRDSFVPHCQKERNHECIFAIGLRWIDTNRSRMFFRRVRPLVFVGDQIF